MNWPDYYDILRISLSVRKQCMTFAVHHLDSAGIYIYFVYTKYVVIRELYTAVGGKGQ